MGRWTIILSLAMGLGTAALAQEPSEADPDVQTDTDAPTTSDAAASDDAGAETTPEPAASGAAEEAGEAEAPADADPAPATSEAPASAEAAEAAGSEDTAADGAAQEAPSGDAEAQGPDAGTAPQVEAREVVADVEERTLTLGAMEEAPAPATPAPEAAPEPSTPEGWVTQGDEVEVAPEEATPVDLPLRRSTIPDYPGDLESVYGDRAIRCTAEVRVDDKGRPIRVAVTHCPDGFHLAAAEALTGWRWEPPEVAVPEEGLLVEARVGFRRKNGARFPGVTWLANPDEVTALADAPVLLKSGKMPKYPAQVKHGDDVCVVEMVVTDKGKTKDPLVDECAVPFRKPALRAVKTWKWYPQIRDGEAVDTRVITGIVFHLENSVKTRRD